MNRPVERYEYIPQYVYIPCVVARSKRLVTPHTNSYLVLLLLIHHHHLPLPVRLNIRQSSDQYLTSTLDGLLFILVSSLVFNDIAPLLILPFCD